VLRVCLVTVQPAGICLLRIRPPETCRAPTRADLRRAVRPQPSSLASHPYRPPIVYAVSLANRPRIRHPAGPPGPPALRPPWPTSHPVAARPPQRARYGQ